MCGGLATCHGPGQAITPPNGTTLTLYRDQGAAWVVHGWHYAMLDTAHPPATPAAAIHRMNRLDRAVGSAGNPVGRGTSGWAVEVDGSAGTQSRVVWTHGPVAYEIDGLLVSAITLARNWVEVST